jgi:hypothetical protein
LPVPEQNAFDRELQVLTGELRSLEQEYTLFFAGRMPRPPIETRTRLDRAMRRLERASFDTQVQRFRFQTLQARYSSLSDLWDRGVRAREEGRPGPFARRPVGADVDRRVETADVVHATTLADPAREMDKLHDLYGALMDARRRAGHDPVPFHRFAEFVKQQVATLQQRRTGDVTFKVIVRDGKVQFTASRPRVGTPGTGC